MIKRFLNPPTTVCLLALTFVLAAPAVMAERIKDIADVAGVRQNQLLGYGLVVGLDGTGDKVRFTSHSMKSMLNRFGVAIPSNENLSPKNAAAVMLTANLPPFAKPGQPIDVTVSTLGDAKSLRGGTLLYSPLKGADGEIYAMAQGNLVVGGFGAATADGNKITVNVPTVGRVPNGATVERVAPNGFATGDYLVLNLHRGDFTTANRLAEAINKKVGAGTALPIDATSIRVSAPVSPAQRVSFVSFVENLQLAPAYAPAKVIVNSRTGTVVIGRHVRVTPAAVAHGNLSVTISNDPIISQPNALSDASTVVVPNSTIEVSEEETRAFVFEPGASLNEIVRAINRVGAAPSDLVAILEALREAGSLTAQLVVI